MGDQNGAAGPPRCFSDGKIYGRCLSSQCACSQFNRKFDSTVICECGCVARKHQEVQPCANCRDCKGYEEIGCDECKNCPHKRDVHYEALIGRQNQSGVSPAHRDLLSFDDIRRQSQQLRTSRQEMLHSMRFGASGVSHGGRRQNAGRKSLMETKPNQKNFEVAAIRKVRVGKIRKDAFTEAVLVPAKGPHWTAEIVDSCRRLFSTEFPKMMKKFGVPLPLSAKEKEERIYLKLAGPSFVAYSSEGNDQLEKLGRRQIYYYHPDFDCLDDEMSNDSSDESCDERAMSRKRPRISTNGVSTVTSQESLSASAILPETSAHNNQEDLRQDDECSTRRYDMEAESGQKAKLNAFIEMYPSVEKPIMEIIVQMHNADGNNIMDFMEANYSDGKFTTAAVVDIFHRYVSALLPDGGAGVLSLGVDRYKRDDESDAEFAENMKKQLEGKFKRYPDKMHMKLDVRFIEEAGVGEGLTRDFVGLLQTYCFDKYFDGEIDFKIPRKGGYDQQYAMVGRLMACAVRQKIVAYSGLSSIFKAVLFDKDVGMMKLDVQEVPNYELRTVLEKVIEDRSTDTLNNEEKLLLSRVTEDAEIFEYVDKSRNDGLFLPRKGEETDFVYQLIRNVVYHQRRGQFTSLVNGINSICHLSEFLKTSPEIGQSVVDHYFPSVKTLTIGRETIKDAIEYHCSDDVIHSLIPTVKLEFEKFIASLNEGFLDKRSTAQFLRLVTGDPFMYPGQRIIISLVATNVGLHPHTCSSTVEVSSFQFTSEEAIAVFRVALDGWISEGDQGLMYNSL